MKIHVVTSNADYQEAIKLYVPIVKHMMVWLSQCYHFKLPDKITLRPKKQLKRRCAYSKYIDAIAGYSPETGYYISLNMNKFDKIGWFELDTLAHEVAHIVEGILHDRFSHSERFNEIYIKAQKLYHLNGGPY